MVANRNIMIESCTICPRMCGRLEPVLVPYPRICFNVFEQLREFSNYDAVPTPLRDDPATCPREEDIAADGNESQDETEHDDDEQLISDIRQFADDAISKLKSNRALFRKPLQSFIRNSKAIVNDSHLVSAMHTYGRYNGAALATRRLGCKARLQSSTQIGVQPLAVARRKVPLLDAGG